MNVSILGDGPNVLLIHGSIIGVNLGELAVEVDNLGDRRGQAHSCDHINEMLENSIHSL